MADLRDAEAAVERRLAGLRRVVVPLRDRNFARYFTGQLLSQIGDGIFLIALPFLVLRQGGGSVHLGIVLACYGGARLAALQAGGTLADSKGARLTMLSSDALRAVAVAGLAWLSLSGYIELWAMIAFAVPFGFLDGVFQPASYAVLPDIVGDDLLPAANSLNATMQSTAQILGPAVGGLLVAGLHSTAGLIVDAITFALSSATLYAVRSLRDRAPDEDPGDPPDPIVRTWGGVLRYLLSSPLLRMSLLITIVVNLVYDGMMEVALPSFVTEPLRRGPGSFGVIMAGFGVGCMIGALAGDWFTRRHRRGRLALLLGIGQGLAVLSVPLGASLAVATASMFVAAALQAVLNVFYLTMLQRDVPAGLLGRVMSLMLTCAYVAYPASTVISGTVVAATGPVVVIVTGGLCIAAAFAIGFTSKRYRNL